MSFNDVPDQNRVKKILQGAIKNNRVANAYLFIGQDSTFVNFVAKTFAQALNCEGEVADSCGECLSCRKITKEVHPDIIMIYPNGENIKIERIRELRSIARYGPVEGKWKVAILKDADKMTIEAANSFLKVLEEPPSHVVFILVTSKEEAIPKTIISRCQRIIFGEMQVPLKKSQDQDDLFLSRVDSIDKRGIVEILELSKELSSEGEMVENILNRLLMMYRERIIKDNSGNLEHVKIILNTLKGIQKNANKRLALDNMLLKIKEVHYDKKISN